MYTTAAGKSQIRRYRYGDTSVWVLQDSLEGSRALRVMNKIDLHFRENSAPLIVDLREVASIDSVGAAVLEKSRLRHPMFSLVGRPLGFDGFPLDVRIGLDVLRPGDSLEAAISMSGPAVDFVPEGSKRRAHTRIPVQIPVEIFLGTMSTAATLRDLSIGGSRVGRLPYSLLRKVKESEEAPQLQIVGLDRDPLGKEIAGQYGRGAVASSPVHILPDNIGLGMQFSIDLPPDEQEVS